VAALGVERVAPLDEITGLVGELRPGPGASRRGLQAEVLGVDRLHTLQRPGDEDVDRAEGVPGEERVAVERVARGLEQRADRRALAGFVEASVGTATHYHADYVSPYWAPKLAKIKQLGAHIFYAWPGAWGQRAAFSSRYSGREYIPSLDLIRKPSEEIEDAAVIDFAKTGLSCRPR